MGRKGNATPPAGGHESSKSPLDGFNMNNERSKDSNRSNRSTKSVEEYDHEDDDDDDDDEEDEDDEDDIEWDQPSPSRVTGRKKHATPSSGGPIKKERASKRIKSSINRLVKKVGGKVKSMLPKGRSKDKNKRIERKYNDDVDYDDDGETIKDRAPRHRRTWAPLKHTSIDLDYGNTEIYEARYGYNYSQYLTGRKSLDRVCNIWHLLFLFLSVCLVIFGIIVNKYFGWYLISKIQRMPAFKTYGQFVNVVSPSTEIKFTGYIQELGLYLIVINSLYTLCCLSYVLFPFHKFSFTMPLMCTICGLLCVIEMAITNIAFNTSISQSDTLITELKDKLLTEYNINRGNTFSVSYDYISILLSCCGIVGHQDFQDAELTVKETNHYFNKIVQVTPTCCKSELFEVLGNKAHQNILECASRAKPIYQSGCFTQLTEWLQKECRYYTAVVVVHLMDCLIHAYIYKNRIGILYKALYEKFGVTPLKTQPGGASLRQE